MFIAFFIVTNVVTMAFGSYKSASWQDDFGNVANFFYCLVFGWECLFKLFALCPLRYYQAYWNWFDFFIVMLSFGGILIDLIGTSVPMDPRILRVLRLFRVFRVLRAFRILKSAKGLTMVLVTLVKSLPALRNLLLLLSIWFFIFGVLGVSMFGGLCIEGEEAAPGLTAVRCAIAPPSVLLDPKMCFRDIGHALISLFRVASTDGWSSFMYSVLVPPLRPPVTDKIWQDFLALNGTARPNATVPPGLDPYDIVRWSIRGWNRSVWNSSSGGYVQALDWPYPAGSNASGWMQMARNVLGNCITDDEASMLEAEGMLDCSDLGQYRPCLSTCTDSTSGNIYFFVFTLISAFVLMQLVIAVLLEQLVNGSDKASVKLRTPGCMELRLLVFGRMYRRWRFAAMHKLKKHSRSKRRAAAPAPTSSATQPQSRAAPAPSEPAPVPAPPPVAEPAADPNCGPGGPEPAADRGPAAGREPAAASALVSVALL